MVNQKKMFVAIVTTLILLVCFFAGLYLLGIKSEPYRFALKFIDDNQAIIDKVGKVKNRYLAFFGYSVRYRGPSGHADYKIVIKGEKGKGTVYLKLEKSIGKWKVLQANLELTDDKIISLIN